MKVHLLFLAGFFCAVASAQSSGWLWATQSSGVAGEGYAVCTDQAGDVFITGAAGPNAVFGNVTVPNAAPYLVKYDPQGNVIWGVGPSAGNGGAAAYAVCSDLSGNIYIAGYFTDPVITFGSYTLTNTGAHDLFIVKYSPAGSVLWAKSAGGNTWEEGNAVSADAAGNVYLTGWYDDPSITFGSVTLSNAGGTDGFVVKYNSSGNVVWALPVGNSGNERGAGISVDNAGNIYATGSFGSFSVSFGSTTLSNTGVNNTYVVKFDGAGNVIWAKSSTGSSVTGVAASADAFGNVYITGYYYNAAATFDSWTLPHTGNVNSLLVKYTGSGTVSWAKSSALSRSDGGWGVSADVLGQVYMSGFLNDSLLTFGLDTLHAPYGVGDPMYIVKYDSTGSVLCDAVLKSGGDDQDGICTDYLGNLYVTGDYGNHLLVVGTDTLTSASSEVVFLAKYNCAEDALVPSLPDKTRWTLYPNPASGSFSIVSPGAVDAEVVVFNASGSEIIKTEMHTNVLQIGMKDQPAGLYLVRIVCGTEIQDIKVVLE